MPSHHFFLCSVLAICFGSVAQPVSAQPTGEEPVLPEVVVEPADPGIAADGLPGQRSASSPTEMDRESNDASYPDLADLLLGSDNRLDVASGALRGTTSLFQTPFAGSITTQEELREKQSTDMLHALQQEVGVMLQSTAAGQASPFVRGVTGQQVLILMDGIRLNNSVYRFGPNQYFNTIDPGMVDHIEVVRGQGSVLWGSDAIGGVINVVSRGPDIKYGQHRGDYGGREFRQNYNTADSASYTRFNVEGWAAEQGVFAGGSFLNVRNLDTGFAFGRQPGTNYQQYAGDIKFNRLLGSRELLTVAVQHLEQEDLPRSDRYPGYPGDRNDSNSFPKARFFDPQQRDLTYVRYQALDPLAAVDAISFTASYHRQREVQTGGVPTTRFQETDVHTVGLNLLAARDLDHWGKATVGLDWYHDDIDSAFGGSASGPIIPDDAFYERFGGFLNWDVPLTARLHSVAGVRYETIDLAATPTVDGTPVFLATHYQDWLGHLGLSYALSPCVRLVGSVAEGFRAPNLNELTANNPNVLQDGRDLPSLGLVPENSITYEVGLKANRGGWRSQAFVYWMDLNQNIVPITAGANEFRRDNQDAFIQGAEFDAECVLGNGWSAYGNMTYTFGKNRVTQAPLSRIPPTQGVCGLRWRNPCRRGYFAVYTWLVRRQDRLDPVRDLSDERIPAGGTPGFATLNFRAGHDFGADGRHRISLNLENATDKAYLVHGSGVFGTGFTARLGYSCLF